MCSTTSSIEIKTIQRETVLELIFRTAYFNISFPFPKPILSYISSTDSTFYGFIYDEFSEFLNEVSSPNLDTKFYKYDIYIDLQNKISIVIDIENQLFRICFNNIMFSTHLDGNIILGLRQFGLDYANFMSDKYIDGLCAFKNYLIQLQEEGKIGCTFNFKYLFEEDKYCSFITNNSNKDLVNNFKMLQRLENL